MTPIEKPLRGRIGPHSAARQSRPGADSLAADSPSRSLPAVSVDKHVAYEVDRLRRGLDLLEENDQLSWGATPNTVTDLGRALHEAALVHIRNLLELLVRDVSESDGMADTVRAADLGNGSWSTETAAGEVGAALGQDSDSIYAEICKHVHHISRSRSDVPALIPTMPQLAAVLVGQLTELVSAIPDSATDLPILTQALDCWDSSGWA